MNEQYKPHRPGGMRRFRLDSTRYNQTRHCIAQGVVFGDGATVLRWINERHTAEYSSFETMCDLQVQDGVTIRWEDHCCFVCGTECGPEAGPGFCVACGAAWRSPADTIEPGRGQWAPAFVINPAEKEKP